MISGFSKHLYFHWIDLNIEKPDLNSIANWLPESLKGASTKRKEEYLAGRFCAKEACKKLGFDLQMLNRDQNSAPEWPGNIIGSISHSKGMVMSVVAQKEKCGLLGLDIEKIVSQKRIESLEKMVLRQEDKALIQMLGDEDQSKILRIYTLIFSAKEAFYKFLFPKCQVYFGFKEAYIPSVSFDLGQIDLILDSERDNLKPFNGHFKANFTEIEGHIMVVFEADKIRF